jgi:tetratricopeptide (TPR) repeat protein
LHLRAVALAGHTADDEHEFGVTLLLAGRYTEARGRFLRALQVEPGRPATLTRLAEVELVLANPARVCQLTNAAIAANPFDYRTYLSRAIARLSLAQAREAYADAETALQLSTSLAVRSVRVLVEHRASNRGVAQALGRDLARSALAQTVIGVEDGLQASRTLVALGMRREALEVLRRVTPRGIRLRAGLADRDFDAVRGDSVVQAILGRRVEAPLGGR